MELILSRHGNTFNPGEKVVMAGLTNDLHLVEKGGKQAEMLAAALKKSKVVPDVVLCGELVRHRRYAEIVMEQLGLPHEPIVDKRLNELDYGLWTGLSDAEIAEKFGEEHLQNWQKHGIWPPKEQGWGSTEDAVIENVHTFVADLKKFCGKGQTALVISSGGTLRYFLTAVAGAYQKSLRDQSFRMKTGHIGKIKFGLLGPKVKYWNRNPEDIVNGQAKL